MSINIFSPSGSYTSPSITNLLGNGGAVCDGYIFAHKRAITIHGNEAASASDYQMKLNIYNSTGTNVTGVNCSGAAGTVYAGTSSFSSSAFSDLRFGTVGATTGLPYWIESSSASVSAVVWVKIPAIPASASADTTIYMYYGNAGAAAVGLDLAAGKATFLFFDDFNNGTTLDAQWNSSAGTRPAPSGGYLTVLSNSAQNEVKATGFSASTFRMRFAAKQSAINAPVTTVCMNNVTSGGTYSSGDGVTTLLYNNGNVYAQIHNGGATVSQADSYTATTETVYEAKCLSDVSVIFTRNDNAWKTFATGTDIPDTALNPTINSNTAGNSGNGLVNWYFISTLTANEPTWSSFGAEEGNSFTFTSQTSNIIIGDEVSE